MSARPSRASSAWLATAALVMLLVAAGVRAEPQELVLDVSKLSGGVSLVEQTDVLEDPSGRLTIDDMMKADAKFVRSRQEASYGFTRSSIWLRFRADNPTARAQTWLLELAYPHLDQIDLYATSPGGPLRHWEAGDLLPFAAREVQVPTFVFSQETPPHSSVQYYLRVRGVGTLRIPLRAWLPMDLLEHEYSQNLMLWLFYGVVAAMTFYNIGTTTLLRQREYALFVGLLISLGSAIFTLSGQTFQYVLPHAPLLANRALGVCMSFGLLFLQLYAREVFRQLENLPELRFVRHLFARTLPFAYATLGAALFAPRSVSQQIVFVSILLYVPVGVYQLWRAQAHADAPLRMYMRSFYCLAVTIPIALLAHARIFPPSTLAIWAGHIGCAAYSIMTSLALPARINDLGQRLEALNQQLSANVVDLKLALAGAERATKVKDEFMATMSHELRTPLNAIINVPQGLLEDFQVVRAARCSACQAEFLLDASEQVEASLACGGCGRAGTLRAVNATLYSGDPAHTARFLHKIERSGNHLLQMVNGVLDYSKMEAGRLTLNRAPVDLRTLLGEVIDEMSDLSSRRGIGLTLQAAESDEPCLGDALRIRQVMLNLLNNAIKFSEANSQVVVTWQRSADVDTISVTDEGIGIAAEDQARVFVSFEQVHKGDTRKYGGTGLGLSISRSLVRMHGGELWVQSELGAGSTFWFTLPRQAVHGSVEPVTQRMRVAAG